MQVYSKTESLKDKNYRRCIIAIKNQKTIHSHQIINVQAYKHDGKLYRQWSGVKVWETSPEFVVLFMYKTKVEGSNGQKWTVREPTLWYFPRDSWFNTTALIRNSGSFFYTNLASPFIFEDNTIKYIDYDLDIKAYPGKSLKIVDKAEWERHKIKYNYPESIIEKINNTQKEVIKIISFKEEFFDYDVIDTYIKELVNNKDLSKKFLKINWE